MTKAIAESSAPKTETVVEAPDSIALSIDEFCTRKSVSDRRVELIGAFHHDRVAAGHLKDTEEAFDAELAKFANKPA